MIINQGVFIDWRGWADLNPSINSGRFKLALWLLNAQKLSGEHHDDHGFSHKSIDAAAILVSLRSGLIRSLETMRSWSLPEVLFKNLFDNNNHYYYCWTLPSCIALHCKMRPMCN